MSVVSALTDAGADVESVVRGQPGADEQFDAILDVRLGHIAARFAIEERRRAPYPNELSSLGGLKRQLTAIGSPMLVVPFVTESLARHLSAGSWSWADAAGNFDLRAEGLILQRRQATAPPRPTATTLPQGTGSFGVIRALIRSNAGEDSEPRATSLAAVAKVTQPRASQVLRRLHELSLVMKGREGQWIPDREALLDRFLAEYRGPGGSEHHLYSLDAPTEVARQIADQRAEGASLAISADVGPDLVLSWRRPTVVIVYSQDILNPAGLGLVTAQGRHDANVIIRYPNDTSVFSEPELVARLHHVEIPLADPTQLIWDLHDLGGADRLEAAGMLRQWLLSDQ